MNKPFPESERLGALVARMSGVGTAAGHAAVMQDAYDQSHGQAPAHQQADTSKNTVNDSLTAESARPVVENDAYAAFARRVLRAYSRRIARGDIAALTGMADLAEDIDTAVRDAITGLRSHGYSWADIGRHLGVTRQAAQQRWGASHPQLERQITR